MRPGTNCADAPVKVDGKDEWFLHMLGDGFKIVVFGGLPHGGTIRVGTIEAPVIEVGRDVVDEKGILTERYDGGPGAVYLIRPDQYVAGRWRGFDADKIAAALARATCQTQ